MNENLLDQEKESVTKVASEYGHVSAQLIGARQVNLQQLIRVHIVATNYGTYGLLRAHIIAGEFATRANNRCSTWEATRLDDCRRSATKRSSSTSSHLRGSTHARATKGIRNQTRFSQNIVNNSSSNSLLFLLVCFFLTL